MLLVFKMFSYIQQNPGGSRICLQLFHSLKIHSHGAIAIFNATSGKCAHGVITTMTHYDTQPISCHEKILEPIYIQRQRRVCDIAPKSVTKRFPSNSKICRKCSV